MVAAVDFREGKSVAYESRIFHFQRLQDMMTRMHRENLTRYTELQVCVRVCCGCQCDITEHIHCSCDFIIDDIIT